MSGNSANKKQRAELLLGHTPVEAIDIYADVLTTYEKTELYNYETIYTIGSYRVHRTADI